MALNLSFSVSASEDGKYLVMKDTSSNFTSGVTYSFDSVSVATEFDGLWEDHVDLTIAPTAVKYTSDDTAVSTYTSGISFYIAASAIFGAGVEYIYDNLYSVTIEVTSSEGNVSTEVQNTVYPLSRWYTNNKTASYNYYDEDTTLMKNIINYHTWLNVLDTASEYGDSATVSVILKSFKKLIDGYGLPE